MAIIGEQVLTHEEINAIALNEFVKRNLFVHRLREETMRPVWAQRTPKGPRK
jgi:hypothetical protein